MKTLKTIFILLILITIASCSDNNETDTRATGNLTVKLSDAPMHYNQFSQANVTIDHMDIRNSSNGNSFTMLTKNPMHSNLLDLVNGNTETIANMDLPEGNYDLMRLYISSTEMVMNGGESYTYNVAQHGYAGGGMMGNGMRLNSDGGIDIALEHPLTISNGSHHQYLLDIDVNNSFVLEDAEYTGMGSGMMMTMSGFTFSPMMRFVDMETAGTIQGVVHGDQGELAHATISLMLDGNVYTSTHTNGNGHYALIGIPEDSYTIMAEYDGYMMSSSGNEGNKGALEMVSGTILPVDFNMIPAN
ncbi:DUF4382 domain-containing protein [Gillisia limnaea]|uniref:DUF4382 domain-containing protein n=1 Tax=Gillisia limnaea (strain DSM 15749 / LMG 21470 / R-8282) TaxID=865937 RepID=H2BTG5_GILLR|nr:DUF4382 domain-containing protein [Gillisia limnaea]EHQ01551.1 hypothetical protein Gilli_0856 [Gillisia limnaea DSM 15749]